MQSSSKSINGVFDACRVLAFMYGTARRNRLHFYRHRFYSIKRIMWNLTEVLSFPPTASPLFVNRESPENRESFGDANHSPLPSITTIWTFLTEVIHREESN